jgi:hypothetical protein
MFSTKKNRVLTYLMDMGRTAMQKEYEERRRLGLMTQSEVCEMADCSPGRLQYHTRHGWVGPPSERLFSRFYYGAQQAREIAQYFKARKRWERTGT